MKQLTLGSLFDGIGGFPLAAQRCGIKTLWASEIEPNCISITKRHFPKVAHLGSITEIDGGKIPPVDIISFGSPCQDLSTAGKQKGLDGERSGLFMEATRIIYEMREATNGQYPTFIIWENVPGAFASNKGNDFRTVLKEITKTDIPMPTSGKWATAGVVRSGGRGASIAWRQLDAQFWGVPQRRKRIFLVGDFGGERGQKILFEFESLLGYSPKSGKKRERITANIEDSVRTSSEVTQNQITAGFLDRAAAGAGSIGFEENKSPTLRASMIPSMIDCDNLIFDDMGGSVMATYTNGICPTLRAQTHGHLPCVIEGEYISEESVVDFGRTADRIYINSDKSRTITSTDGGGGAATGLYLLEDARPTPHAINLQVATRHNQLGERTGHGIAEEGEPAYTLQAAHSHAVFAAYPIRDPQLNQNSNGFIVGQEGKPAPTLSATDRHVVAFYEAYQHYSYRENDVSGTLTAGQNTSVRGDTPLIAEEHIFENNSHAGYKEGCGALRASGGDIGGGALRASGGDIGGGSENLVVLLKKAAFYIRYVLRKLTPLECERLQGFPDYWTKYNATGAEIADTPRYVALGNSLAVPCAERIFRGIAAVTGA